MNDIILSVLGVLCTSIIIPLIVFIGQRLAMFLESKAQSTCASAMLEQANSLVVDVLAMLNQTVVEGLKEKGKFDKAAQQEVLEKAKTLIVDNMSDCLKKYVAKHFGDIDHWLVIKIESILNRSLR